MRDLDLIAFIIYIASVLGIGGYFYRTSRSSSSFTLGNNKLPAWVVALSFFATYVSSISYLALPGSSYQGNWNAFVFSLSIPVAAIVGCLVFVPLYRKVQSPSAYAFLEQRFGVWARVYASSMYLLTQLMRIGTILYLMGLIVHSAFGWDLAMVIIFTGSAVAIYSMLGGIQAVAWTDALQSIVLITGALVCVAFILVAMPEGAGQVFKIATGESKFSLGSLSWSLKEPTFWVVLVYGIFINLQNYGIDQNYVQRYMMARNEHEAKKSAFWGGMLYIPVSLLFLFIGTALFAYYNSGVFTLPATVEQTADQVFPYFIVNQLPVGLTGLLMASIFAAGMSTISTSFNSAATVILTDYVGRFKGSPVNEKQKMTVLYFSTILVATLGIMVGMAMINVKSALDAWWKLASVFSGGMLGLFLLGVFSRIKSVKGAVIGTLAGLLVILCQSLGGFFSGPEAAGIQIHTYLTIVTGTLTIFLVGFAIGIISKDNVS